MLRRRCLPKREYNENAPGAVGLRLGRLGKDAEHPPPLWGSCPQGPNPDGLGDTKRRRAGHLTLTSIRWDAAVGVFFRRTESTPSAYSAAIFSASTNSFT